MKKLNVAETKLEKTVQNILNDQDGYEDVKDYLNDLLQHGCISGMVSKLIYYNDTIKWYKEHAEEINRMIVDLISEAGYTSPVEIFGKDKWDIEDPFAYDTQNQNLLAWFSFEETARNLANKAGIEI